MFLVLLIDIQITSWWRRLDRLVIYTASSIKNRICYLVFYLQWCQTYFLTSGCKVVIIYKIFPGYQLCQVCFKNYWHSRDHLCPHHRGYDVTMCPDHPIYVGTEMVHKTLVILNQLKWLIAWEGFINVNHCEGKSYHLDRSFIFALIIMQIIVCPAC
jgi:hypothetical protein